MEPAGTTEAHAIAAVRRHAQAGQLPPAARWKRYLFLRLGEQTGQPDLKPPRCDGCEQQPVCFAAEAASIQLRR